MSKPGRSATLLNADVYDLLIDMLDHYDTEIDPWLDAIVHQALQIVSQIDDRLLDIESRSLGRPM